MVGLFNSRALLWSSILLVVLATRLPRHACRNSCNPPKSMCQNGENTCQNPYSGCYHLFPSWSSDNTMVCMVDRCPGSEEFTGECQDNDKHVGSSEEFQIDTPVIVGGIVYANAFCARCHSQYDIELLRTTLKCNYDLKTLVNLSKMLYDTDLYWEHTCFQRPEKCVLEITYNKEITEDTCSINMTSEEEIKCYTRNELEHVGLNMQNFTKLKELLITLTGNCPRGYAWKPFHDYGEDGGCGYLRQRPPGFCETLTHSAEYVVSAVLLTVSLACMALHMTIFLSLPKRQNTNSKNLFCMTLALFVGQFFLVVFFNVNFNYHACIAYAIVKYYFLFSSSLWMNVISYHMYKTFCGRWLDINSKKLFFWYSLYAWGVPLIAVTAALCVDFADTNCQYNIRPQFGTTTCWFNHRRGMEIFFTIPSKFIIIVNFVLFIISVTSISSNRNVFSTVNLSKRRRQPNENQKTSKLGKLKKLNVLRWSKSEDKKVNVVLSDEFDAFQNAVKGEKGSNWNSWGLHLKLALVMGLAWTFAILYEDTKFAIFQYLFKLFMCLQGTFIFIAFDCKKKIWQELLEKFRNNKKARKFKASAKSRTSSVKSTHREVGSEVVPEVEIIALPETNISLTK